MICIVGNLPVLKVGHHHVVGYGTEWIDESLSRAAIASNRHDFPFIDDIRDGVMHYLEHRCPLRVLPLEDLYERMRVMLRKIGCDAIANNLVPLAPPITVSLVKSAREAGNGFELVFFCLLTEEINLLRECGAESIRFCEIKESASIMRGGKTTTKACQQLCSEIVAFLEGFKQDAQLKQRRITLSVDL
ncbi:MAG TPA: hypothetical protein DDW68_05145 [Verrucomicrobiales bacterium]|nr:hypothetical protein [Verrucomicrobiales bacterium]HBE96538.1 hypothetical protein [Verrucomicrobiales bacterium]